MMSNVTLHGLDYEVLSKTLPHEVFEWCVEHIGPRWNAIDNRFGKWAVFWAGPNCEQGYDYYRYLFSNEKDAILFMLRWAS